MQEHNPSLIPIIVAEDSRKIERTDESRKQSTSRGVDGARLDEVPMGFSVRAVLYYTNLPRCLLLLLILK